MGLSASEDRPSIELARISRQFDLPFVDPTPALRNAVGTDLASLYSSDSQLQRVGHLRIAELLTRAYAAIKKANPKALVLGCSTAGIDEGFIKRTMELGAPFDVLTIHPYRGHLDDRAFISDLTRVADLAKRPDGTRREVWITEMGWGTHVPHNAIGMDFRPTTERDQAKLLARAYIDAIASGVAPNISWYDFRNDGNDPLNFEYNMGIVTRDFRPKPAYRAYATLTAMLEGKRAAKPLDLGRDIIAWEFAGEAGREPIRVLWCTEANRTLDLPSGRPIVVVDLMGERRTLAPAEGKVSIALQRDTPVFLIEATAPGQP